MSAIIINLSVNKMLWKRHLSIYTSGTPKLGEPRKQHSKGKAGLAPLISAASTATAHRTLEALPPKFLIRKKSRSTKNMKQSIPNTFYLHKGNNSQLVKAIFEEIGCIETVSKDAARVVWYQGKEMARKDLARKDLSSKILNYFPNHSELTNKQNLYENLVRFKPECVGDFVPKTFVIDFKESLSKVEASLTEFVLEYFRKTGAAKPKKTHSLVISNYYGEICILFSRILKMLNEENRQSPPSGQQEKANQTLWIVKPSFMNRGQGIEVISSLKQLEKILSEDSQQISIRMYQPEENSTPSCYVIQDYIMNPMLYRGFKFDIRVWILLRKSKKEGLQAYLYQKGYARLAGNRYSLTKDKEESKDQQRISPDKQRRAKSKALNDPYMHLTNNAVQKNGRNYGELHEGNQLSIQDLITALGQPSLTCCYLFTEFKRIIEIMVNSCKEKLLSKANYGTFQLMGLDFMIDTAYKVWLIQANCNPCLEESSSMLKEILPKMLKQLLQIVNIQKIMGMTNHKTDISTVQLGLEENLWQKIIL